MTIRAKIDPDAAPSSAAAATAQWRRNRQKSRDAVPAKESQPFTPKFDRTWYGLKVRGLVFEYANPLADHFTLVRREIAEYVRKEYTDGGDVRWTLERENMKKIPPP